MTVEKKLKFARALREANKDDAERIQNHFQSRDDIFTTCPKCGEHLRGTFKEVTSHRCTFPDLIGG